MNEIWKTMKESKKYEVSSFGRIRTKKTGRIRKTTINNKGYEQFLFYIDKKPKSFYVHRVVANNFLENPNNYKEVNHKDENKLNNNVDNLEYCNSKYNANYGTRNARVIKSKKHTFKRIIQKDKNGKFIKEWSNIIEIKNNTNYNKHSIYKCCEKKYKTAYGYKWEYADIL